MEGCPAGVLSDGQADINYKKAESGVISQDRLRSVRERERV